MFKDVRLAKMYCNNIFENVYYVPVEKRRFQDIRIEILRQKCCRMVNQSIYKYLCRRLRHAFIMKDPLLQYYLHQVGRGWHGGIGPIYLVPPFLQRGHGLGSFLSGLFRVVRPVLWRGIKAVGRDTLRTGGRILSDLADNTAGVVKPRHIIAKHVGDSADAYSEIAEQRP